MAIERSDKLFEASRDAQQKFDYFVLGIIGALCAFIGQSFKPEEAKKGHPQFEPQHHRVANRPINHADPSFRNPTDNQSPTMHPPSRATRHLEVTHPSFTANRIPFSQR
jgi:hypothetical protein